MRLTDCISVGMSVERIRRRSCREEEAISGDVSDVDSADDTHCSLSHGLQRHEHERVRAADSTRLSSATNNNVR